MAALASSAVSLVDPLLYSPNEYFPRGLDNRGVISRRLKLVLTGQGGATNTIGAFALGLNRILECSALWDATNSKVYPAVVDPVNNVIILADGSAAPAPVDVTSTATYITVMGTTLPSTQTS